MTELPSAAVPGSGDFRAVIVDDWPMLRAGIAKVLIEAGGRVVADTGDATVALGALRAHHPEVMIVGDHAASSADLLDRALAVSPDTKFVALLSATAADDLRPLLAVGLHAALSRTVDPSELVDVVARVLAGQRVVSPGLLSRLFEGMEPETPVRAADSAEGDAPGGMALTAKEREVLRLLAAGRSNAEIAAALYVSGATVKTHLAHIYGKLSVRGRYEALNRAATMGLLG